MNAVKGSSVPNNVAAAILAAGAASRFGSPKQLATVNGKTLLELSVRAMLQSGADHPAIILGAHAEQIRANEACQHPALTIIQNDNWQSGMSSSIKAAVDFSRQNQATHLLLMVCDQPQVTSELTTQILALATANPQSIVACKYENTAGIPAIFPAKHFDQLYALTGDRGAKNIILNSADAIYIDFPAGNIDVDTPQDLKF